MNDCTKGQQKIVTALGRFLHGIPMEDLLNFLTSIGVRCTFQVNDHSPNYPDHVIHRCRIYFQAMGADNNVETIREYTGGAVNPKSALTNAIAKFFICEDHDFHDYQQHKVDTTLEDKIA